MIILQSHHGIDRHLRSVVCLLMVFVSNSGCPADDPAVKTRVSPPGEPQHEIAPSPDSTPASGQQHSSSIVEDYLQSASLRSPAHHSFAAIVREPRLFTAGQRNAEIIIQFSGKSRYAVTVNGTEHQVFGSELHLHTSISRRSGAEVRISVRNLGLPPEVQLGANALTVSEQVGVRRENVTNLSVMRLQTTDGPVIKNPDDEGVECRPELRILLHAGDRVRISAETSQTE